MFGDRETKTFLFEIVENDLPYLGIGGRFEKRRGEVVGVDADLHKGIRAVLSHNDLRVVQQERSGSQREGGGEG